MTSPARRPSPRAALAVAGTAVVLALGSCSLPDGGAPAPASASPADGVVTGTPSAAPAPERPVATQTLTADGIELLLAVPVAASDEDGEARGAGAGAASSGAVPVTVTPDEDGSSRVAFVLPADPVPTDGSAGTAGTAGTAPPVPTTIDLVSPADGSLVRNSDGSVTVLDAAGAPLGGFSAPEATEASGPAGRAGVVVVAPTRAEVHAQVPRAAASGTPDAAEPAPLTVTTWLGAQAVRSATWGEREGGRSLAVDPTPWARQSGIVGEATVWAQLVASEPEAASTTMRDQLDCHALGATDKRTWNLEPWRPDVGFVATAAARCNPT